MKNYLVILLLVLPTIICTFNAPNKYSAFAEVVEDEIVESDGDDDGAVTGDDVDEDVEASSASTSPYVNTYLLFTKPLHIPGQQLDLPGGKPVEFLIGFANKGPNDFIIETIEASFRYPMDYNYHIQNFSAVSYNREVKPGFEATVSYSFLPSDTFASRPFGLNINLQYRDADGVQFSEAVFNETVLISEVDEGLDGETFFLYVLLAGIVVLLLVIGQQYLVGSSGKRKRGGAAKKTIETGTANDSTIDYEWLPQETLRALQKSSPKTKSPKTSPKPTKPSKQSSPKQTQSPKKPTQSPKQTQSTKQTQSPKQRKVKRSAGDD